MLLCNNFKMQKKLTIQTKSVGRLIKDVQVAHKEVEQEQQRLEKMLNQPEQDNFRLNQQRQVLQQAEQSVPDYQNMLKKGIAQLEKLITEAENDLEVDEQTINDAKQMVENAKKVN